MTSTDDEMAQYAIQQNARPRPLIDRSVCIRRTTIICTLIFSGLLLTNLVGCSDDYLMLDASDELTEPLNRL